MDRNEVCGGRQGKMERFCCSIICDAPTTVKVKGMRLDEILMKKEIEHTDIMCTTYVVIFYMNIVFFFFSFCF